MDRYTVARKGLKTSLTLLENYLKNTVIDPVQAKHRFELLKSKYETYLQVFEQADDTDELYSEVQELSDMYYQLLSIIPTDTPETKPVVENSVANITPRISFTKVQWRLYILASISGYFLIVNMH